uniref:Pyrophosphate--fructose 6-phosphate 1-phosphotransferase n=1 Tax=uncultured Armatimonadetes bacterium TaxID=157466 RepID=A0A6J4HPF6_9BACT|nr:Pyrophosphate-dependent fructose 6-phosphate-1-kinase [uncultured Armatimonadetes bacterium]
MKVGILTGGGDCPGLNPAIRGVVYRGLDFGFEFVGIQEGWRGLVKGVYEPLTLEMVEEIIYQGGTILGSSRTNPFKNEDDLQAVLGNIKSAGFDAIVACGGEDTLGVAAKLYSQHGVPTVGVPKTMDNDLNNTDFTFGFDTAAGVGMDALDRLRDTARSHRRVMVLEVMGRHAGWVALYVGLAGGADWITLPEQPLDVEAMCAHLKAVRSRGKKYALVVASEGTEIPTEGEERAVDAFGHVQLGDRNVGEYLASVIEEKTGWETRSAVVGHVHRGGSPTLFDRVLGLRVGVKAAELVRDKEFGKMAALKGTEVVGTDIVAATATLKTVPPALLELAKTTFK